MAPLPPVGAPGPDAQPAPRRAAREVRTRDAELSLPGGREQPPPGTRTAGRPGEADLPADPARTAEKLRERLREIHEKGYLRELRMDVEIERDLGLVMVKIIDARTDKVIRTVPPREQVEFARKMEAFLGLLFDQKA